MNIFRLLGDLAHIFSKCILLWSIHRNTSTQGISLLTQGMYTMVFCTRYLDLFWSFRSQTVYNTTSKLFYIASSFYILFIMLRVYPYTREGRRAWVIAVSSVGGAVVLAIPLTLLVLGGWHHWTSSPYLVVETFWTSSIILESVCIIPQIIILRQSQTPTTPTVINAYYLLALGCYRGMYILSWVYRALAQGMVDPVAVGFGVVQTVLYLDFAWVYYCYGRRGGGEGEGALVVDGQDSAGGRSTTYGTL